MKTATLIAIIWILLPFTIVSTICAIRFLFDIIRLEKENESLKEQLEKRNLISIAQGVEIEMLTTERKALNQEVINQMLEDYDHENLIAMNT